MDENLAVMIVSLPLALEEFVRQRVATGQSKSADEVVCEGLRLLREQEAWKSEARKKIDEGWEEAHTTQLLTPEQVRQELADRKKVWMEHGRE